MQKRSEGNDTIDFEKLNAEARACNSGDGFIVWSFDGCRLVVVGGFDLACYHTVEVEFQDVLYCSFSTYMMDVQFRLATSDERRNIGMTLDLDDEETVFAIDADAGVGNRSFFIVAKEVIMRVGNWGHGHRQQNN